MYSYGERKRINGRKAFYINFKERIIILRTETLALGTHTEFNHEANRT